MERIHMKKFVIFWKKITWIYVRFIQKILITFFLTIAYITLFPFLWIFNKILGKEKLITRYKASDSYWKPSKPLVFEQDNFINQS